jgi:hypothetical protein
MAELDKQQSAIGNAELAQRFVQFVMMQAQNIFYVLGRIPSQDGRPIPPNLEAAKILVDQLEMIQEKTRGNLSAQESSILNDALKNVRLAFVEASGGTPASMMPKSPLSDFPLDGEDDFAEPVARPVEKPKPAATSSAPAPATPAPTAPEPENKKKFSKTYG